MTKILMTASATFLALAGLGGDFAFFWSPVKAAAPA